MFHRVDRQKSTAGSSWLQLPPWPNTDRRFQLFRTPAKMILAPVDRRSGSASRYPGGQRAVVEKSPGGGASLKRTRLRLKFPCNGKSYGSFALFVQISAPGMQLQCRGIMGFGRSIPISRYGNFGPTLCELTCVNASSKNFSLGSFQSNLGTL
jgi:hypothetical protein